MLPPAVAAAVAMDAALSGVRSSYIVADICARYYHLAQYSPFVIEARNLRERNRYHD
jgi:hypothetical protein